MKTSTHRKGECPPGHDAATVTFDNSTGRKVYTYWVPTYWQVQPGDKLRVFVSERRELKTVTVRDMHAGLFFAGCEHKIAANYEKAPPTVVGIDWAKADETIAELQKHMTYAGTDTFDDQMAYYRQAFRLSQLPTYPCPHKETAMKIETPTIINGQNINSLSDDQLFEIIAIEETKIKALRGIENKPQKLKDKINGMQADIERLIKLIDER